MAWFNKFVLFCGIVIAVCLWVIDIGFSDTQRTIIISFFAGIFVFLLYLGISRIFLHFTFWLKRRNSKHVKALLKIKLERSKKRNNVIAFILLIIITLLFFIFFLNIRAMLGHDLLISLKVDTDNFVLNNGDSQSFNVKAKIASNPFCASNCSIYLEDLGQDKIIDYENIYLQVSSPLSKDYVISVNEQNSGQKLYRVTLQCDTVKQRFCYTTTNSSKLRTKIISVEHGLNDLQKIRKNEIKNETETINREFYKIQNSIDEMQLNYSSLDLSRLENQSIYLENLSLSILYKIHNLNELYDVQNFSEIEIELPILKDEFNIFTTKFNELNYSLYDNVETYNSLIENASLMYDEIAYLQNYNFSEISIENATNFVNSFNLMIKEIDSKSFIENKIVLFDYVNLEKQILFSLLENETNNSVIQEKLLDVQILPVVSSKINILESNYSSDFSLAEPKPICCLKNQCYKCIDNSSINYPVILVHGHSFNQKLSAEVSLESFSELSRVLENEGYINGGYFYSSKYDNAPKGDLGEVNASFVVEATYYIETNTTEAGSFIFDSKFETIDTYASRLNDIVENLKYITGKDKVIIVAHSMGGLVTRRYMQIYGSENVDKVVLVGIPNQGIDGFVLNYCPVFGAPIECSEMDKNSNFMSELKNASPLNIPVYNIIGLGCSWEDTIGDGIIKNESAFLPNATENIYVYGTCKGVNFFHVNMIFPSEYPEIYEIIKEKIKE